MLDETRQPLGIMQLGEALRLAQSKGLDLIEIAPTATPPVCRIIEYGRFQYEESKKKKESHARQSGNQMKEIQITANIDVHDFNVKLSRAIDFLCDDMKVRIKLRFRGRQKAHKEFGFEVVNRFIHEAAAYGRPDALPKMAGDRDLHVTLTPLPRDQRVKRDRPTQPPAVLAAESEPDTPDATEGNTAADAGE